jgi:hypothetical protein
VPPSETPTSAAAPVVRRRRPADRAVSREDAEQLTFDEPPEAPQRLEPGEIPRARDRR